MKSRHIPGAVVVVMRDGTVLKESVYGVANLETGERVTPSTAFFIASITRASIAAAVFRLIDAGRLGLEDSIGARLSEIPSAWRTVTVHQLLDGTSALPSLDQAGERGLYFPDYGTALDSASARPMAGRVGQAEGSLMTDYVLLGRMIEASTGSSYPDAVRQTVFTPLGLTSAAFGDWRILAPGRAEWYTTFRPPPIRDFRGKREVLRTNYPDYFRPVAGMFMSARDLATLADAMLTGRLLKASSCERYWEVSPAPVSTKDYAPMLGSWTRVTDGSVKGEVYWHEGGVRTAVLAGVSTNLVVVVLTNLQGGLPGDWIYRIYNAYADAIVRPPSSADTAGAPRKCMRALDAAAIPHERSW